MHGFRYYFTQLTAVLFTFPSRYLCAIGRQEVLSLGGWAPQIPTGFHVSGRTWDIHPGRFPYTYGPITLCGVAFQPLLFRTPLSNLCSSATELTDPATPIMKRLRAITHNRFRLTRPKAGTDPLSLAATEGVEFSFCSCRY